MLCGWGGKLQVCRKVMAAYRRVDDTCRLTACTPGSAPGPTLGIEYGKAFTFFVYRVRQKTVWLHIFTMSEQICMISGTLQRRFVQNISVILIKVAPSSDKVKLSSPRNDFFTPAVLVTVTVTVTNPTTRFIFSRTKSSESIAVCCSEHAC